jgi:hypothetical protein
MEGDGEHNRLSCGFGIAKEAGMATDAPGRSFAVAAGPSKEALGVEM